LDNDGCHNIAKDDTQRGPKSNESEHEGLLFGVISKEDDPDREVDAEEDLEIVKILKMKYLEDTDHESREQVNKVVVGEGEKEERGRV
jgi:hypothetical protein